MCICAVGLLGLGILVLLSYPGNTDIALGFIASKLQSIVPNVDLYPKFLTSQ
jgi:hypothetical protein